MFPVILQIGGFKVYAYGMMLALAFGVGTLGFIRAGQQQGLSAEKLLNLTLLIIVAAMLGSRLLYVILALPAYLAQPGSIFNLRSGGLSFHGGLAAGAAVGLWYAHRQDLPQGRLADTAAPYVALGYGIARLGCLLNGCCYGRTTALPWALPAAHADDLLRHPTQLYAAAAGFLLFFVLRRRQEKTRFAGQLFLEFLLLYGVYRFLIEFFRAANLFVGFLTLGQAASLVGAAAAFTAIRVWPLGRGDGV
ncbi:MAG: prolipoprotein diacylglyceryl transferase [Dethiobacteraceae bacterium]|jgi:phosphatidylglycerol:prolipoprotein diacylglycerol transferase|nr:prolipoprotein diacylglyceryl transferase [Bacillota bacterium]